MNESLISTVSIVREIGHGGFGRVYLTKSADGKLYALKRVYTSDPAYYKKEIKSLKLYGELIAKSDIKNIIPILDVRTTDSEVEYLMPLADGMNADSPFERSWEPTTLTKLVKARYDSGGTFTAKEAVEIFKPLIEAVSKLNDKGVIHRDIKPDNILFIGGKPYIADIGLLREDTASASSVGTPVYSSPSWYTKNNGNPDMWGIVTTLYFFLSGNSPDTIGRPNYMFPRSKEKMSKADTAAWHHFHRVVLRATRERPVERYLTIAALLDAFLDVKEKHGAIDFSESATTQKRTSIFLTSGRIDKKTYTCSYIVLFVLIGIGGAIMTENEFVGFCITWFLNWPLFAINTKRAHDGGRGIVFAIVVSLIVFAMRIANAFDVITVGGGFDLDKFPMSATIVDALITVLLYLVFISLPHENGVNRYGVGAQRLSLF